MLQRRPRFWRGMPHHGSRKNRAKFPIPICYDQDVMYEASQSVAPNSTSGRGFLRVVRLETTTYEDALAEQRRLHRARILDETIDTLLLTEHPHVYTLGRNSDPRHILADDDTLRRRGAVVCRTERGGEVTYHGPGQLIAYPIIKLQPHERSIKLLVTRLEEAIIRTLGEWSVAARRDDSDRGVWVGDRKIASIGMSLRGWVAMHGMALNVRPDLSYFGHINPCGHQDLRMTSMALELERSVDVGQVGRAFARQFGIVFERTVID
jgi:lipoate-protein ligase B